MDNDYGPPGTHKEHHLSGATPMLWKVMKDLVLWVERVLLYKVIRVS